jgi:hypothetical protein
MVLGKSAAGQPVCTPAFNVSSINLGVAAVLLTVHMWPAGGWH